MIPQHFIDELLARVDVLEVIGARVALKRAGRDHMGCCPFHDEKTPSFSVSQSKQFYHCFGCGANGNAIGFLIAHENLHFVDAIETLAESVGLEVPRDARSSRARGEARARHDLLERLTADCRQRLRGDPEGERLLGALGIGIAGADHFELGSWPSTGPEADAWGDRLGQAGLHWKGGGREGQVGPIGELVVPVRDSRGRVLAMIALSDSSERPGHVLQAPDAIGGALFGSRETVSCRVETALLVAEAPIDAIRLRDERARHIVSPLNRTRVTPDQVACLFRMAHTLVFLFGDGASALSRAARTLRTVMPHLHGGQDVKFLLGQPNADSSEDEIAAVALPAVDLLHRFLIESIGEAAADGGTGRDRLRARAFAALEHVPRGLYRRLAEQRLETLLKDSGSGRG